MKKLFLFALVAIGWFAVSCSSDSDSDALPTANPTPDETVSGGQSGSYSYNADELDMARLINEHRQEMGEGSLVLQDYVSLVSQNHNTYMIANEVVNHDLFGQRVDELRREVGANDVAENVAFNYQTSVGAFDGWLSSDGHRTNIEGNFTHFGVSVSGDGQGRKYYTAIFVSIIE
ncbi:CAP domain-containing protein [Flavobacterium sp.]|uniref:CAP domain-containing protein n=1 Tax=Flavobacterium sp. TaxID=239 RepID=UPI0025BCCA59|nr:CAP domain-containing protein [Flavobacterium sp.]